MILDGKNEIKASKNGGSVWKKANFLPLAFLQSKIALPRLQRLPTPLEGEGLPSLADEPGTYGAAGSARSDQQGQQE